MVAIVLQGEQPNWITGYGSGYGYGYGYGYGDGYGSGDGSGDGSGYGSGDGSGDGYGDGYGYGYGDGSGDGSGSGSGSGDYWSSCLKYFTEKLSTDERTRLETLKSAGATIAYWRSDKKGLPSNGGGMIEIAAPGVIHKAPGPLNLCNRGTLHATMIPPKWKGDRWWVVALIGEIVGNEEKYGALEREIIGECI